jgi:hypothetical protein
MKKILIFGYSHCGTTILKSIISHIESVYTLLNNKSEIKEINENDINNINNENNKYEYILCKYSKTKIDFFKSKYKDYIKIFIIRNPLYVFSSINNRCCINCECHSLNEYIYVCKLFNNYLLKSIDNLYLIKYEDIFIDNFLNLKTILDKINFVYTEDIFDNTKYINFTNNKLLSIPIYKPDEKNNLEYRTWQINQPFINNNDNNKINLTKEQFNIIINNRYINNIYKDINKMDIKDINIINT